MGYNRSRSGRGSARGKPRPSSHAAERPTSTRHPLVGVLVIVTVALVLDAAEALDIGSEMNESGHVHVNLVIGAMAVIATVLAIRESWGLWKARR